ASFPRAGSALRRFAGLERGLDTDVMMLFIPFLVVVGIAAGPLLSRVGPAWARCLAGWLLLAVLILAADRVLDAYGPLVRMIGLCCVLLGGMKGLVYAEWVG